MNPVRTGTASSTDQRSWWLKHRWLLLRRTSQLGILGLFLLGPLAGGVVGVAGGPDKCRWLLDDLHLDVRPRENAKRWPSSSGTPSINTRWPAATSAARPCRVR